MPLVGFLLGSLTDLSLSLSPLGEFLEGREQGYFMREQLWGKGQVRLQPSTKSGQEWLCPGPVLWALEPC